MAAMFQFFKRKSGKVDAAGDTAPARSVARAPNDKSNENPNIQKHVVNLLLPEPDYTQKTGVGSLFQKMGKKRRGKKKGRTESYRIPTSPPQETHALAVQRGESVSAHDVTRSPDENSASKADAEFVKALVLQKYAKTPAENNQHVCTLYVANEPDLDEKRRTEALLREIARSIDCTVDQLNDEMGGADSKGLREPVYHTIDENGSNCTIDSYKSDLKNELSRLTEPESLEGGSPNSIKKSSLKPPKSDIEGCSDDDRSDNGKKKVTFRKHIVFDDGEQQTDEENNSSFDSLSSGEEEEYLEDIALDKTVIEVNEPIKEDVRMFSDNSDSGFLECDKHNSSDELTTVKSESESETEEEIIEEIIEEEISEEEYEEVEEEEIEEDKECTKSLVSHDGKYQNQLESRTEETERARELIAACRKEIETKDQEIEQLKCELAAAYKESELIRQRSRSLEDDLTAARNCSADLADQLKRRNDECMRDLRTEIEDALAKRVVLESRALALERDRDKLEQDKISSEKRALEALAAAEETAAKWRSAHEAARSQASARAERILADCEWKMRELEKRARDAEGKNKLLSATVDKLQASPPTPAQVAELQQMRGLVTEQQRSIQAVTLQLQKLETREEALKLEVHRLKELLERSEERNREREEAHAKIIHTLEETHAKAIETQRSDHAHSLATTRSLLERGHAERTRAALAQLRAEGDQAGRNADRKLREITNRFDNLKEVLAAKETQFEAAIAEARSKADWDILQLRHLLDKADIDYANKIDNLTRNHETETERLNEEWSEKLSEAEAQAASEASEAKQLLEATRLKLVAEKLEQVNKLKEQHRKEMEDQWEQFMCDKESCLERMKSECRQEGDEERVKREKELLEEIEELKSQVHTKSHDFDNLVVRAAACGRTLAVTEQELREALAREKELRDKRSDDAAKIKQLEKSSKDQVEHLTRKCACLRKLFDDIRARLNTKERASETETRARDKELHQLRGEVARLTKLLVEQSAPKLGARTRADGCEMALHDEGKMERRPSKVILRKRTCPLPELGVTSIQNGGKIQNGGNIQNGRLRANSVNLPAVQVPVRIKQLEGKTKIN